jgi:hypothetical protein
MTGAAKATIQAALKAHRVGTGFKCKAGCDVDLTRTSITSHQADQIVTLLSLDDLPGSTIPARATDPVTSHKATKSLGVRAGTQRHHLLRGFRMLGEDGGTDEQAMATVPASVNPMSEYAKRCSELREAGQIEPTGQVRKGASGMERIVSRITERGLATLTRLEETR